MLVKNLYITVSPTGIVRSANDQDLKISSEIYGEDTNIIKLKNPTRIRKGVVIPSGYYVETGAGDIYQITNVYNIHIRITVITTNDGTRFFAFNLPDGEPGLYRITTRHQEPEKLREWVYK